MLSNSAVGIISVTKLQEVLDQGLVSSNEVNPLDFTVYYEKVEKWAEAVSALSTPSAALATALKEDDISYLKAAPATEYVPLIRFIFNL